MGTDTDTESASSSGSASASVLSTQTQRPYTRAGAPAAGENARFNGCYLLASLARPARSYVGYTVNPSRRLRQHNGDVARGGAVRTKRNRPWAMVAVVHGFACGSQALQFEWAWQNPHKTKALKLHAEYAADHGMAPVKAKGGVTAPSGKLAVLAALLAVPPWSHCPLTVSVPHADRTLWTKLLAKTVLPPWARVDFRSVDVLSADIDDYNYGSTEPLAGKPLSGDCGVCAEDTAPGSGRRGTVCVSCGQSSHLHCLARSMRVQHEEGHENDDYLLPDNVTCPRCRRLMRWNDVVRFSRVAWRSFESLAPSAAAAGAAIVDSNPHEISVSMRRQVR
jgi:predicted GIY-YIG superfamily endonuclease